VTSSWRLYPNKKIVTEFTKNTGQHDVGRWELWSCNETTIKGHHFVAMPAFRGKIGVTPLVPPRVTPNTNPSE